MQKMYCTENMTNKLKKIISFIFLLILAFFIFAPSARAESNSRLYLNKLKFDVTVNKDGSMDVVETWNIDISHVNTLYKTFEKDKDKFASIENVRVKDITANKEFSQIDEEMYHVTEDCYYGLTNSKGDFEIAWGVGLDNSSATRTYEISYTVKDAIGKYNDMAELYWQFVGEDFEVDANKITGTITLPESAEKEEDIKVWGHTEDLNGEIYVTGKNEVKFQLEDFDAGKYVEVRVLFPTDMISSSGRTYDEDRYDTVLQEERKWANQANLRRKVLEMQDEIVATFIIFLIIALCIIFIEKAAKYGKKLSELTKFTPEQELDYFRELPEKDATPGEAVYILHEPYNNFSRYFGKIFSATLLDLKLKGYIDLRVEKTDKKKDKIYIRKVKLQDFSKNKDAEKILESKNVSEDLEVVKDIEADNNKAKNRKNKKNEINKTSAENQLKPDEKRILEYIYKVKSKETEIEIKELEEYIKKHPAGVDVLIRGCEKDIERQLSKSKMLDKKQKEELLNYSGIAGVYYVFAIITLFWAIPLSIVLLINGLICSSIKKKANVLTQKGVNSKEKWKGLKKYMEDFSLLNEKEVPAIEVWEHYLVYATAFGIADKVLKQLKTIYPNIDELDAINTSTYMYFMYHSDFQTSFSNSISSSISSSYTSASGGGGGFSGGGGGGRRPEEAVVEDKLSQNHITEII